MEGGDRVEGKVYKESMEMEVRGRCKDHQWRKR